MCYRYLLFQRPFLAARSMVIEYSFLRVFELFFLVIFIRCHLNQMSKKIKYRIAFINSFFTLFTNRICMVIFESKVIKRKIPFTSLTTYFNKALYLNWSVEPDWFYTAELIQFYSCTNSHFMLRKSTDGALLYLIYCTA